MKKHYLAAGVKRLIVWWLSVSVFLLLIIIAQTFGGKYDQQVNTVWAWFAMHVLPGTAVLVLAFVRQQRLAALEIDNADIILYRLLFWLALLYLGLLLVIMLIQPFGKLTNTEAENLHVFDMGLFFFQGLLLVLTAAFMYRAEKKFVEQKEDRFAGEPGCFISYNHADKQVAGRLKEMLTKKHIPVTIDAEAMLAGEDIKTFIERSVLNNRTTISIVSEQSLLSGWVGMETVNTFFLQKFSKNKQFIACYLDDGFFNIGFTAKAIESFDTQLQQINAQIDRHKELGVDSRDLNETKTRLLALRYNLDEIVQRLRNSLCIDIRDEKLTESFPLLLKSIKTD